MTAKVAVEGGIRVGNLFFLSGVCCEADSVEAELRKNIDSIAATLAKQGATLADVVSVTVYLRDIHDRERCLNRVWQERFPEPRPARTTVEVGIGKCRCELQAIACLPS